MWSVPGGLNRSCSLVLKVIDIAMSRVIISFSGVRMCGKNFSAIASILGTKTAEHVQTFFDTYRQKFKLETVYQEWLQIGQNDE